jgi:chromosome segregation ATPase
MLSEKIKACLAEIESLEKQINSFNSQLKDFNAELSLKNSNLQQLNSERENLETSIHSIGFFKFKERKPFKEKLSITVANIKEVENTITELNNKISSLTKQESDSKLRLQNAQQKKEKLQKLEELNNLSEQGQIKAQYELAVIYYNGIDIEKDKEKAIYWLKKASEQGHEEAKKFILQIEEDDERIRKASYDITLW